MSSTISLPGDEIASIEEYEAGQNTFDDGDRVRAAVVGRTEIDKKLRVANVAAEAGMDVPEAGDVIVGTVAAVMSSMIAVAIRFINGRPVTGGVECVCPTRNMRMKTVALANDVMVLKIVSHLNGTIHATMSEPNLGILFTRCRKCGMKVIPNRNGIKCTECGWFDERKLSSDFGNGKLLDP